jgi:hypothetical protein
MENMPDNLSNWHKAGAFFYIFLGAWFIDLATAETTPLGTALVIGLWIVFGFVLLMGMSVRN